MRKLLLVVLFCGACAEPFDDAPSEDAGVKWDTTSACTSGQTRCVGQSYQQCTSGTYTEKWKCPTGKECVVGQGCLDCDPQRGAVCVGNDVYTCVGVGKVGVKLKSCLGLSCVMGQCTAPKCDPGARLVYVVDSNYNLLSFDPSKEKNHFTLIKKISCPAGAPWPARQAPATPFSMSVDRSARAWILYTSGEIFWVSTKTGICKASSFSKGQQNFKLFGMGFVSDKQGSDSEKMYVTRAQIDGFEPQTLGYIDPATMKLNTVGTMPKSQYSAELSGTSKAELYAYHPGSTSFVNRIDPKTAKAIKTWNLPAAGGQVAAWAFAHWGGKFYIFITTLSGLSQTSKVLRLDPSNGNVITFLPTIPYRIVGAGVSTCAPIIG